MLCGFCTQPAVVEIQCGTGTEDVCMNHYFSFSDSGDFIRLLKVYDPDNFWDKDTE